ncbi:MAG: ferredoxin [Nitrospina sp.]|nr:ferredoxin [Nitrospina sp.]
MAISKVWIEKGCIACGMSESICPEVFKVNHGKLVKGATVIERVDYSALEDKIWQAVNACPVELIKYESA